MAAAPDLNSLKDTLLFLATAGVVVPVFHRLKISPILGFIAAGVLLGPHGLGRLATGLPWLSAVTLTNVESIGHIAEFGVVFLMFMIGLELSWERLSTMRRLVFGLGSLQVAVTSAAIGVVAWALGQTPAAAAVLGGALALSSTAIVLPVLAERRRLQTASGRASFAVLLFQDLAVAPFLVMIAVLGARDGGGIGTGLLIALAPAALTLFAIVGVGRLALRPLFHHVARTRSVELFMAACLFVVLGTALTTAASGMSMALGAFVAGLLLAETEYRREVEVTLEPFKGLLLGVFFVSIGAGLDLGRIAESPVVVLAIAIGVVALKSAILFGLGLATGMTASVSRNVALPLGPCGEFAFVMIGAATALGLVPAAVGQTVLLAVTLSMVAIPTLIALTIRRGASAQPPGTPAPPGLAPPEDDVARVLVAGYGRVGRLVGDMLARHEIPYIAVDGDADVVRHAHAEGRPAHYGDAARPEFLRRCGIGAARALVVTMDAPAAVERVVAAARAERADLTIVARARDAGHATKLYTLGATDAVPETIEASLQLSEAVLVDIGIPMGLVIASIHEKRDEFRKLLNAGDDLRREPRVRRTVLRPKE